MMNTTTTTRRPRSLVALAAAVVLLPGLLAACSSGTPKAEETSGSKSGSGTSLASCMRDKGYDMPDPDSGSRAITLSAPDGIDEDQWGADLQSCMGDQQGAAASGAEAAKPMPGAEKKFEEVTKCIRAGGFSDYPDGVDAQAAYRADDQDAFADIAKRCSEESFGTDGTVVGK